MENKHINGRFEQLENILKWYGLDVGEFMYMGEEENGDELNSICVTYVRFKHINTRDYLYLLIDKFDRSAVQVPAYPNKHFKRGEFLDKATNLKEIKSTPNGNIHILRP